MPGALHLEAIDGARRRVESHCRGWLMVSDDDRHGSAHWPEECDMPVCLVTAWAWDVTLRCARLQASSVSPVTLSAHAQPCSVRPGQKRRADGGEWIGACGEGPPTTAAHSARLSVSCTPGDALTRTIQLPDPLGSSRFPLHACTYLPPMFLGLACWSEYIETGRRYRCPWAKNHARHEH